MNGDDYSYPDLLAAAAVSVCDTWSDPAKRREQVVAFWRASFGSPPGLLAAAADAVADLPKPIPDKPEHVERRTRIREMLDMK